MDKRGLLVRIERAWSDLAAFYAGLPDALLGEAGVTDAWSVGTSSPMSAPGRKRR